MHPTVKFLRLERISTGSFLTHELPYEMDFDYACVVAEIELPDFEVISGYFELTPDVDDVYGY